jgi:cell division protease FtsH
VASKIDGSDPVHKISIIPRGHMALGYTLQLPEEDRFLVSKKELSDRITILLSGRVTELLKFGDVTTGASNDLERATQIARQMVTQFGMSDRLGLVTLGRKQHEVFLGRDIMEDRNYSEEIAYAIDQEVRSIIDECFNLAKKILTEHNERLEEIAALLLEKEVLEGEELDELLGYPKKEAPAVPAVTDEEESPSEDEENGTEEDSASDSKEEEEEKVRERSTEDADDDDEDPDDEEE